MLPDLRLRPYDPVADRPAVAALWRATLEPAWPVLPWALDRLPGGWLALIGPTPVGLVAVDPAGSVPLIAVDPAHQRQGIGTALLAAALRDVGSGPVAAGRGGGGYIWPGVPLDLPAAVAFFAARGWTSELDVLDLTQDLRGYRPPEGTAPVRLDVGAGADVLAFEQAHFPQWVPFFTGGEDGVLAARDAGGEVVGTLLFHGPVGDARYGPMLGPASGEIGCVGVAPHAEGRGIGTALVVRASELLSAAGTRKCHIGWAVRERFYGRAGYLPWRRYRMFELAGGAGGAAPPASH